MGKNFCNTCKYDNLGDKYCMDCVYTFDGCSKWTPHNTINENKLPKRIKRIFDWQNENIIVEDYEGNLFKLISCDIKEINMSGEDTNENEITITYKYKDNERLYYEP
jgi:hypothetical protein